MSFVGYPYKRRNLMEAKLVAKGIDLLDTMKLEFADIMMRLANFILNAFRTLLYRTSPGKRILIFRTGSIGDSVCAIPAIEAIRENYPGSVLHILTNAGDKNLVGLEYLLSKGIYDEIIDYGGISKKKLFRLLRNRKYDLIIQLPQVDATFASLLRDMFFFRSVAKAGFGWHKSQISIFRKTQAKNLVFYNEIDRLLWILSLHGIKSNNTRAIIRPKGGEQEKVAARLKELGWNGVEGLIAMVVGAKRPSNRWPIEYFDKLIEHLGVTNKILLIGSIEDLQLTALLQHRSKVLDACGQFTPLESAAALSLCRLSISNDTGPMHLSYGVGTPTIALFSSRDLPGKWYPPNESKNHVFRELGVFCRNCSSGFCKGNYCMRSIKPAEILKQAEKILAAS